MRSQIPVLQILTKQYIRFSNIYHLHYLLLPMSFCYCFFVYLVVGDLSTLFHFTGVLERWMYFFILLSFLRPLDHCYDDMGVGLLYYRVDTCFLPERWIYVRHAGGMGGDYADLCSFVHHGVRILCLFLLATAYGHHRTARCLSYPGPAITLRVQCGQHK